MDQEDINPLIRIAEALENIVELLAQPQVMLDKDMWGPKGEVNGAKPYEMTGTTAKD